jgi:cation transport regulator ChaC
VANGTGPTTGSHAALECGGDVGGVVYTIAGDKDYETDFQSGLGVKEVGEINHRR